MLTFDFTRSSPGKLEQPVLHQPGLAQRQFKTQISSSLDVLTPYSGVSQSHPSYLMSFISNRVPGPVKSSSFLTWPRLFHIGRNPSCRLSSVSRAELSEVCLEAIPVPVTLLTRQISPFNRAQVCVMLEQTKRQPIYISQVLTGVWLAGQKMCFFKCCLFQEAGLLAASAASSMRRGVWWSGRCIHVCCPLFTSLIISVVKSTCFHCVPVKGGKSPCITLWLRGTDSACYQEVCLQLQFGLKLQHHGQSHCIWFALELLLCLCYFPLLTPVERQKKNKTTHKTHALSRLWWILFTLIMYYTKRN